MLFFGSVGASSEFLFGIVSYLLLLLVVFLLVWRCFCCLLIVCWQRRSFVGASSEVFVFVCWLCFAVVGCFFCWFGVFLLYVFAFLAAADAIRTRRGGTSRKSTTDDISFVIGLLREGHGKPTCAAADTLRRKLVTGKTGMWRTDMENRHAEKQHTAKRPMGNQFAANRHTETGARKTDMES